MTTEVTLDQITLAASADRDSITTLGWIIAPGLAVAAEPGYSVNDGRYALVHVSSGQKLGYDRCGAHTYEAVERAVHSGIDWTEPHRSVQAAIGVQLGDAGTLLRNAGCTCWESDEKTVYQPPAYQYPPPYRPELPPPGIPEFRLQHGIIPVGLLWEEDRPEKLGRQAVGWWVTDVTPGVTGDLWYALDSPDGHPTSLAEAQQMATGLVEAEARSRMSFGREVKVKEWRRAEGGGWLPSLVAEAHFITVVVDGGTVHHGFEVSSTRAESIINQVAAVNEALIPDDEGHYGGKASWAGTIGFPMVRREAIYAGTDTVHFAVRRITHVEHYVDEHPVASNDWLRAGR